MKIISQILVLGLLGACVEKMGVEGFLSNARAGFQLRLSRSTSLLLTADDDVTQEHNDESIGKMVSAIVKAIDEGREGDLEKAGLKVTSRSAAEEFEEKLNDPQLSEQVLGVFGPGEEEIMRALERNKLEEMRAGGASAVTVDIDSAVLQDLVTDARQTAMEIRQMGPSLQLLTECEEGSTDAYVDVLSGGLAPEKIFQERDCEVLRPELLDRELSVRPLPEEQSAVTLESLMNGEAESITGDGGSSGVSPLEEPVPEPEATAQSSALPHAKVETTPRHKTQEIIDKVQGDGDTETVAEEEKASMGAQTQAQAVFEQLLKTSMDESMEAGAGVDDQVRKDTVEAAKSGDLAALDMDSILGEALTTITKNLGIDMKEELAGRGGGETPAEMQKIVGRNMAELMENMKSLDEENTKLYEKLNRLQEDLQSETQDFEEKKEYELEQLLAMQEKFQADFEQSSSQVRMSSEDLARTLAKLEQTGDVMTALAMFPVKNMGQKVAFVLGLALLFKVPFDSVQLFLVRSSDFSDWFTIFTQSALCVAFMNHYGLVRALLNEATEGKK